jgi:hypothetical protein
MSDLTSDRCALSIVVNCAASADDARLLSQGFCTSRPLSLDLSSSVSPTNGSTSRPLGCWWPSPV